MENNNKNITKEDLSKALTEVRKAYRLIYQFQDQMLKLINYIGSFYGLKFCSWKQIFSEKLSKSDSISLYNWAWDWIPMYYSEFIFTGLGSSLSLLLASDTGWYDSHYDADYTDSDLIFTKEDIEEFETVEKSNTILIFLLQKNKNISKESIADNREIKIFFDKNNYNKICGNCDNNLAFYAVYPLEEFYSLEATDKILKEFAQKAKEYGFNLKVKIE